MSLSIIIIIFICSICSTLFATNADAGNRLFQTSSPQPDDVSAELRFMRHDIK